MAAIRSSHTHHRQDKRLINVFRVTNYKNPKKHTHNDEAMKIKCTYMLLMIGWFVFALIKLDEVSIKIAVRCGSPLYFVMALKEMKFWKQRLFFNTYHALFAKKNVVNMQSWFVKWTIFFLRGENSASTTYLFNSQLQRERLLERVSERREGTANANGWGATGLSIGSAMRTTRRRMLCTKNSGNFKKKWWSYIFDVDDEIWRVVE